MTDQCPNIDFAAKAAEQQVDPELTQLDKTSLELQAMPILATNATNICDVFTGVPRPYVLSKFRWPAFDSLIFYLIQVYVHCKSYLPPATYV